MVSNLSIQVTLYTLNLVGLALAGEDGSLIDYIPGVESICTTDLMSYVQYPDMIPMLTEVVVKGFDHVKEADFILCNTVEELEFQALSALNQIHPTLAIGPINFYAESRYGVARSIRPDTDCTEWLNSKPHGSVLYISFGSIVTSSKEETEEVFHGLLRSEVSFIWVIKTAENVLPSGFEDAMGDQGLIFPWCDQNRVLSSPAVGGFLTHCGWNSILESIWHCVPMICHPCLVDQPTNRKLVVDDWKIGISLCGEEGVGRDEVCEKINVLMKGETCNEMKNEIRNVCKILQDSIGAGGSSQKNLDRFVEELKLKLSIEE